MAEKPPLTPLPPEPGYFALGFSQFTGPFGWVSWLIMIIQASMFFIGVFCAFKFFAATEALAAIKWGISGGTLMIMAVIIKTALMPQMQADRILRVLDAQRRNT